ncbi:hypothetical protein CPB83DRAFT_847235 [Crepidotus variabilis]|uniref:Uncharacterized protein n=1 Tax=Crepidotus variabilis TaxID=179855 RepID=A0A9P6EPE9_9AGAR|nr:hypothetical protein CPB83DRAFT_847235 [Crepidotus variabilis]
MAQPSVEYPPWLTPIPSVITDAAGAPVTTSTSISYVTPIYYGPSIPLGSLYSYGGYSIPPSIQFSSAPAATSTTETPVTTSATPTTSTTTFATPTSVLTTATPTSVLTTATPTSSISSTSTTTSFITSSSSTSASMTSSTSSSTTLAATSSSAAPSSTASGIPAITGLTKPQLVGVIVASILGLVFLFVLALFLFLWWKARKNRREYRTLSPIDDDYIVVPSGIGRSPGEGSPRQSGEETDSFLQRRGQTGGVSADTPTRAYTARVPPPTTNSNSSDSTNSHASGFGVLLERPTIQFLPSMPEYEQSSGQHLSEAEMERLGRENVIPDDNAQYQDPEYSGAYAYTTDLPPPRLVDPSAAPLLSVAQQPHHPNDSVGSKGSLAGEHPEEATVHMARRVKVESLGPRSSSQDESSAGPSRRSSAGALLSALGLGALANLGRTSWFKNFDSPLPTHHEPESPSYLAELLSEKDLETGQHALSSEQRAVDSFGNRPRGAAALGTGTDGSRPISTASGFSAGSGGTQFFDAKSRPGTPGTPILTPLPRAMTPVEQPLPAIPAPQMTEHLWFSSPLAGPPAYEEPTRPYSTHSPTRSQTSLTMPPNDLDILDMPAPTALNNFASISSLKDSATGSSFGMKAPPFPPPGLGGFGPLETTIRPVGWASSDTGTEASDSRGGSLGYATGRAAVDDLSFDVLEEEPPEAEHGWRSIATGGFGDSGRGTFGTLVQGPEFTSEQGSLHSMRSHFNPSNRSSGSAPASSRLGGSVNSNSSRSPSNRSGASSNIHALMHKGSISSDSRKRHAPVSPALSAFGVHPRGRSSPSPVPSPGPSSLQHQYPFDRPHTPTLIGSPPPVYMSPEKPGTIKSLGSSTTMVQGDTSLGTVKGVMIPAVPELEVPERSASASPPLSAFGGAPWAGGLDRDWQPMP